jgi:tRNA(Ile)-lysidine synthase
MNLLAQVMGTIEEHDLLGKAESVVVGVSGGPDSLCLLHVLRHLAPEYGLTLHVAHLEHGIRSEESEADGAFVADLARRWGLPVTVEHADVPRYAEGEGLAIEEAARRARYRFLARVAGQIRASRIAVGHNADDQAETVLMHFLRGSGLAGLRGMLPLSSLGELRLGRGVRDSPLAADLRLIRPLLEVPRSTIEAYCHRQGLNPRFDRSNPGAQAILLDLEGWRALPLSLRRSTLREAIHRVRRSLRNINWVHVENARLVAESGETGAQATLPGHVMLTVGYGQLLIAEVEYVSPMEGPTVEDPLPIAVPGTAHLPGTEWRVVAQLVDRSQVPSEALHGADRWQAFLDADIAGRELILRPRRSGDRFQPLGMGGHSQRVRDFMIKAKIPAAHRDRVPLLAGGERILWVCGWREDERAKVTDSTRCILWLCCERDA